MVTGFSLQSVYFTCNLKHESSLLSPAHVKLKPQGENQEQTTLPPLSSRGSREHAGCFSSSGLSVTPGPVPTLAPAGPTSSHA